MPTAALKLDTTYLRLRSDATAEPLPVDATFWQRLATGQLGSFHKELLISSHTAEADWPNWEMHPHGDEIVCLLSGSVTFLLERDGGTHAVDLQESGEYLIVPKGTWHSARVKRPARLLFITPGEGTEHRSGG